MLARIHKHSIKPPLGAQSNRGHPLAHDLLDAYFINESGGAVLHDAIRPKGQGSQGTVSWTATQFGPALLITGPGSTTWVTLAGSLFTANKLSVSILFKATSSANPYNCLFSVFTGDGDSCELFYATSDPVANCIFGGNYNNKANTAANSISLDTWYRVMLTSDGTTWRLYLNGVASGSTGTVNFSTFSPTAYLGTRGGSFIFTGHIADLFLWNRVLTAAEILLHSHDPYGLFVPQRHVFGKAAEAAASSSRPKPMQFIPRRRRPVRRGDRR